MVQTPHCPPPALLSASPTGPRLPGSQLWDPIGTDGVVCEAGRKPGYTPPPTKEGLCLRAAGGWEPQVSSAMPSKFHIGEGEEKAPTVLAWWP